MDSVKRAGCGRSGLLLVVTLQGCVVQCGGPAPTNNVDAGPVGWRGQTVTGNDRCDDAFTINAPGGTFSGDTTNATNDGKGTCMSGPERADVVYRIVVPQRTWIRAGIATSNFNASLYLREDECGGGEVACNDDMVPVLNNDPVFTMVVDPGEFFLTVDGVVGGASWAWEGDGVGPYVLETVVLPVVDASGNEDCATATAVPAVGGSLRGSFSTAQDDVDSSCARTGIDVVFRLDLPRHSFVRLSTNDSPSSPSFAVRRSSCDGEQVACVASNKLSSTDWNTNDLELETGKWFIVLERGAPPDGGSPGDPAYQLDVAVSETP